jgi:hypothetical protein
MKGDEKKNTNNEKSNHNHPNFTSQYKIRICLF